MKVFARFSGLLLLAMLALGGATTSPAATPPGGVIDPTNPSVSWVGQFYAAMSTAVPEACNPPPATANCDHFSLTVNVPADYWNTHTGGADILITWPSADNDFDLYVYDNSGTLVGTSAAGGTTSEEVLVENANSSQSPYDVRVVPFLVVASGYNGTATFVSQAGGPTPNPPRATGGLAFSPPATVIDAQRTEGEPVNHIDKDGNYWESGPYGTSTSQSFIHRSTDGGNQFNIVSPIGLRPNLPPGGGDTDIVTDDQRFAYFTDLEALLNLDASVSNDDGNTWRKNPAATAPPGSTIVDRQWFAVDNGPTAAASDNTVFLAYRQIPLGSFIASTPGSTGPLDPVGGVVYSNSSASLLGVSTGAPCGQLRFDSVDRYLYYPCAQGNHVQLTRGHVNPGQRTGIVYTNTSTPPSPGGPVGDIFPGVATDSAGNVYVVWIDEIDHNVYYTFSTNHGTTWGPVRQINGNDANSNVFPWIQAGNNGQVAVVWYGNPSNLDSDFMPSWYNNRNAATAFKWFGYAALIRNATSSSPTIYQQRFTDQPMHYGQICQQGLACTTSGGDRTMADFFAVDLDRDGSMRIVFNDTTSQHHGAHLFEVRQVGGPTAVGTTVSKTVPTNPVSDPTGDAQSPHYFPVTGAGANLPQFDFTQLRLSQPNPSTLRVQMTLNNLAFLTPPAGKANSLWLTRFQALSRGDEGEESYRIFYVGAESVGGLPPTFFAGSGTSNNNGVPGTGCTNTTPENCKIVQYPNEVAATGSISGNVITVDVPIQGGFGPGRPILGNTIYNVTALSAGRDNSVTDIYADLDATRAFDYLITNNQPPPPAGACHVSGGGAIPGTAGSEGMFSVNAHADLKGKVNYSDDGALVNFRSTKLNKVDCSGSSARIEGEGTNNGVAATFIVDVVDNGEPGTTDTFSIRIVPPGYTKGGTLIRGNIQIH